MNKEKILTIPVAIVVLFLVGLIVYWELAGDGTSRPTEPSSQDIIVVEEDSTQLSTTADYKDIASLQAENSDIYAWIKIPGTTIDYPILQSEEDNYYLDHKADGTEGLPGAIYTNSCDGKTFDLPNAIVYGHNMKDGSYFGQLHMYEDKDFFDNNRDIFVYLADHKLTYEIIAASKFNDSYLPEEYLMNNNVGVELFLNDLKAFSPDDDACHFTENIDTGDWQQIITLSTCVSGVDEQRYIVVGRLKTVELYEQDSENNR